MSHTPGPWHVQRGAFAAPDLGRTIVVNHQTEEDGWWQIRSEPDVPPGHLPDDLRLIAAVPQMAEALQSLAGDVYLYALGEISQETLLKTQGEALAVLKEAGVQ